jgi:hypothetical protein
MYLDDIGFTEILGMLYNLKTSGQNCIQIIPKGQAELNDELKRPTSPVLTALALS